MLGRLAVGLGRLHVGDLLTGEGGDGRLRQTAAHALGLDGGLLDPPGQVLARPGVQTGPGQGPGVGEALGPQGVGQGPGRLDGGQDGVARR